jgi:hypothetical protein
VRGSRKAAACEETPRVVLPNFDIRTLPDDYLMSRSEAEIYSEALGCPVKASTLAKIFSTRSDGPPVVHFDNHPRYPVGGFRAWALGRTTKPRRSSSEPREAADVGLTPVVNEIELPMPPPCGPATAPVEMAPPKRGGRAPLNPERSKSKAAASKPPAPTSARRHRPAA